MEERLEGVDVYRNRIIAQRGRIAERAAQQQGGSKLRWTGTGQNRD